MTEHGRGDGAVWSYLNDNLHDDDFRRQYQLESIRIAAIDRLINALDEHRVAQELSKADLARAIGKTPETLRRLLTADHPNPTLGTVIEIAAALGLKVTVEPMSEQERTDAAQVRPSATRQPRRPHTRLAQTG